MKVYKFTCRTSFRMYEHKKKLVGIFRREIIAKPTDKART